MVASERDAYLFLALLQARTGSSVVTRLGNLPPAAILENPPEELAARTQMTKKVSQAMKELRSTFDAEAAYQRLAQKGVRAITPADPGYPARLIEAPDRPPALFVSGEIPSGPAVALVGSRRASSTGLAAARALGRALGERGVAVVSGLALGIDAASHEGALEGGGPTVGVLGCGVDVTYPRSNGDLFDRVRRGGALVSEYYLGEPPLTWHFPARNRIIAGLSDVLVVVEAGEKSGALITARHALEAGRDVWGLPGPVGIPECRGSNRLLADGAGVLWDFEEFLETVAPGKPGGEPSPDEGGVPAGLPEAEAAVLAGVGFSPTGVDDVAGYTRVEMREVLSALALLELKGYVIRNAEGAYTRRGEP